MYGVFAASLSVQAELVKFQDTVVLLQDYYCGLEGTTPAQLPPPGRVSLIEVAHNLIYSMHS